MKVIKRLIAFQHGLRIMLILIVVILTIVMFLGITSIATINDSLLEYRIVRDNTLSNAYYYAMTITEGDLHKGNIDEAFKENYFNIKQNAAVESAYTTPVANSITYNNGFYSILLYDPELIKAFPRLTKLGITFSGGSHECVLGSRVFNQLSVGDDFPAHFVYGNNAADITLKVSGHVVSPYKHLEFGGSGTYLQASNLFQNNDIIIMQADEAMLNELSEISSIMYYPDVLFTLKEGASETDVASLLKYLSLTGTVDSLDEIVARTRKNISNSFKIVFIRPAVLLVASMFAYFSLIVLMVRKKSKEMAVSYMIGARKKNFIIDMGAVCIIASIIPSIINALIILTANELDWLGKIPFYHFDGTFVTPDLLWVVAAYFILTMVVAVLAVLFSMGRKSPLAFLRGLE